MKELIDRLYNHCIQKRRLELTEGQADLFRYACEKSIKENPSLDFDNLSIAANIYLNLILDNPTIDLGPIQEPG